MNNLTREEFERFLARLDSDADRAADGYELLRRKLVRLFEHKKCISAEDLTDETIDRVARKLEKEEVRDIASFARGVALVVCMEFQRNQGKLFSIHDRYESEDSLVGDSDPETNIIGEMQNAQDLRCLQKCLRKLSPSDHQLILEYYQGEKQVRIRQRQDLAKRRNISIEALRNEANVIRDKLKKCFMKCLRSAIRPVQQT
jgi:DNA-directed RNA polymerase specialized sigma24 family protein